MLTMVLAERPALERKFREMLAEMRRLDTSIYRRDSRNPLRGDPPMIDLRTSFAATVGAALALRFALGFGWTTPELFVQRWRMGDFEEVSGA